MLFFQIFFEKFFFYNFVFHVLFFLFFLLFLFFFLFVFFSCFFFLFSFFFFPKINMLGFLTLPMVKGGITRDSYTQKIAATGDRAMKVEVTRALYLCTGPHLITCNAQTANICLSEEKGSGNYVPIHREAKQLKRRLGTLLRSEACRQSKGTQHEV